MKNTIKNALTLLGLGVWIAAGWRLEHYIHDSVVEFIDEHEISITKKKKKVGPYDLE